MTSLSLFPSEQTGMMSDPPNAFLSGSRHPGSPIRSLLRTSRPQPLIHSAALATLLLTAAASTMAHASDRPVSAAIILLLGVSVVGALEGVWGGLIAALLASFAYNFFLIQPAFRFSLASLDDYLPLIAVNAGAVAFGLLTGRLKDRALTAELARRRISALLELSKRLQAAVGAADIPKAVSEFAGPDGEVEIYLTAATGLRPLQTKTNHVALASQLLTRGPGSVSTKKANAFLLSSSAEPIGVLVIEWADGSQRRQDEADFGALVNLVGIAVERCLLLGKLSEAELIRKSEEFKSTLLSSISHDMRTPLSAISASASSLARYGGELPEEAKADMLHMIEEQCRRLNRYTTNLLNLGRLQAGLDRAAFAPSDAVEVLGSAIVQARTLGSDHEIVKKIDEPSALVRADPVMLEQVFYNVLENSVRYSEKGAPITVSARLAPGLLLVSIRDIGPGVPIEEFSRIFDRFYRSKGASGPEGSGLGLAIAKGFTEAFGGRIRASAPDDDAGGTVITIELPLAGEGLES